MIFDRMFDQASRSVNGMCPWLKIHCLLPAQSANMNGGQWLRHLLSRESHHCNKGMTLSKEFQDAKEQGTGEVMSPAGSRARRSCPAW